MDDCLL